MPAKWREFPGSWGEDEITRYIEIAIHNIVATTQAHGPAFPQLRDVDGVFRALKDTPIEGQMILEGILLLRSHSAFLGASMLVMGGQATESFMVQRGVLENALYALHIHHSDVAADSWVNRHRSDRDTLLARGEFSHKRVLGTVQRVDPNNAAVAARLYQRTIDFGAHPNERAATSCMQMIEENGRIRVQQSYLAGGTLPQQHALKTCVQIGVCSLYIFRRVFRERFDILGLTNRLDRLRRVL